MMAQKLMELWPRSLGWLLIVVILTSVYGVGPAIAAPGPRSGDLRPTMLFGADDPPPQQSMRFMHLTTEDGLSHNTITAILQDRHGFMWIGTKNGLNRYDGYTFTVYQRDAHDANSLDANSLSHNHVTALYEDTDGALWVATHGGGVNRFDPITETFTRYQYDPENSNSIAGDTIFAIFQDSQGDFWFGGLPTSGGFTRFNPATQIFTRYSRVSSSDDTQGNAVWDMIEDVDGNLWLAADSTLAKLNPETGQSTYYTPDFRDGRLATLHQDEDGMIWLGGSEGLYCFDPSSEIFNLYQPGYATTVADILPNDDGTFWVGMLGNGLYLFDPTAGRFLHHDTSNPRQSSSLSHSKIETLYRDRAGLMWVGTANGLNLYNPRQSQFVRYAYDVDDLNSLAEGAVWGICGEPGLMSGLWVGTGTTLNHLDLASGQVIRHLLAETVTSGPAPVGVGAVACDSGDFVWAGLGAMVYRLNKPSGEVTPYNLQTLAPPGAPPTEITTFYNSGSVLWIGARRGGLIRFDMQRETFEAYLGPSPGPGPGSGPGPGRQDNSHQLLDREVNVLYKDRDGMLWIGYSTGNLSRLDPNTDTLRHYRSDPDNPYSIPTEWIEGLYQDQIGTLWVAARNGLLHFDPSTSAPQASGQGPQPETFTLYTASDGLPNAFIMGIREDHVGKDHDGNLWLATGRGITQFDPHDEVFYNYDVADGVGSTEFTGASWQSADGQIFFGGSDGLTAFYPDQVAVNPYQPQIVLTELRLDNEPAAPGATSVLERAIWDTEQLTLHYDNDLVSFEFAALSYAAPHKHRYRYRLEGLEKDWITVDSRHRFATYTYLPAGDYVFRVQGTNDSGVWSTYEVALSITVLPAWWETMWFRGGVVLILGGVVAAGVRWRMRDLEQRSQLLEIQVAERTRELATRTERLQESEKRFREMAELLPSAIVEMDDKLIITYVNQSGLALFGYTEQDIDAGLNALDLLHPEDRERATRRIAGHFDGVYIPPTEYRIMKKDGTDLPVLLKAAPISQSGEVVGFRASVTDISKVKEAEKALRENEQQLRFITDSVPAYVAYVGLDDLRYRFVNNKFEQAYNMSRNRIIGQHIKDVIGKAAYQFALKHIEVVRLGQGTSYENVFEIAEGKRWIEVNYVPTFDDRGEPEGIAVLSFDITSRKRAEEALAAALDTARRLRDEAQAANRAKSVFLANMSHELRTPLNAILGYSQLMTRDPQLTPTQQEYLKTIAHSGEHLLGLINDVLTMSKIEAGRVTLQENAFDLYRQLYDLEEMFHMRATGKGLALLLDIAPAVPRYIYADEGKLRQVLMNLLSNAIKFTNEGGVTLRVAGTAQTDRYHLLIEVEDTGVGIAAEELEALFDPFVQTTSGQQSQEGTGLGLPISSQFIALMRGELEVTSTFGRGTAFRVRIPVAIATVDAIEALDLQPQRRIMGIEPGQTAPDGGPFRLLIVEDKRTNRDLLLKLLEPFGFDMRCAVNGKEGVEMWEAWHPHLVWMDMRLPVMDGYEATRQIKRRAAAMACQLRLARDAIIVALTASAFEEDREAVLAAGCDDFVRKPFREREIFDVLRRHLGVRFIYEPSKLASEGAAQASMEELRATVETLPASWAADLYEAIIALNNEQMLAHIDAVRSQAPHLSDTLAQWVRNFEYDKLMLLVAPDA